MIGIVICIFPFLLNLDQSMADYFILTPSNVSQGKILLTFKAASLRECVRKCKQTACCEDAATVKGKDKKSLDCYLLGSNETNVDEERLLEMRITRSVEVSLFTLLFIKSKV